MVEPVVMIAQPVLSTLTLHTTKRGLSTIPEVVIGEGAIA
jgi:hypothetical protein